MKSHLETVRQWFHEVWSKENVEAIFELFKPEGTTGGLGEAITEAQQFAEFQQALLNLISNVEITIDDHIERGDKIALICTLRAKKRKDPAVSVEIKGSCFAKMGDGVILQAENNWDFMGLYQQLGMIPDKTFARVLGGEVIEG